MTRNQVFTLLLIKLGIFYLVMGGSGLGPPNMYGEIREKGGSSDFKTGAKFKV